MSSWVKNYQQLAEQDLIDLDELCTVYPWCSGLQVLRAKAHKNLNRFTFKSHIHKASTMVGDRGVLYDIMNNIWELPEAKISPANIPESLVEEKIDENEEKASTTSKEKIKIEESKKNIVETPVHLENAPEKTIVVEEKNQPIFDAPIYDPEKELAKIIEASKVKKQQLEEEVIQTPNEMNFTAWLDHLSDSKEELVEIHSRKTPLPEDAKNLLDQFLMKRDAKKKELEKGADFSIQKIEELPAPDDIITESLAEIYVKQGHYKNAIEAYEKLSLQMPTKKAYFADRIEDIKKKEEKS